MGVAVNGVTTWNVLGSVRLLCLLIILWAQDIGPEEFIAPLIEKIPAKNLGQAPEKKVEPTASGKKSSGKIFETAFQSSLNKSKFLLAFKRQSHIDLQPCLKTWKSTPYSIMLKARLSRQGKLSQISWFQSQESLPSCAISSLSEMDFSQLTYDLKYEFESIEWRVDW